MLATKNLLVRGYGSFDEVDILKVTPLLLLIPPYTEHAMCH
jgi:hypothetical protein